MKKIIVLMLFVAAVAAGCKQQQAQWSQGQAGQSPVVMPAPSVMSPDEVRQLESLAKANPGNVKAWIALGNAQMDAQRFSDAIIAYQRALDLDPKNVDVRVDMGTCYRGVGQPEKAIGEYKKGLQYNPRHAMAYMNSGVVYAYDLGKKAEAINSFKKYLELAPNAPNAAQIREEIQKLEAK